MMKKYDEMADDDMADTLMGTIGSRERGTNFLVPRKMARHIKRLEPETATTPPTNAKTPSGPHNNNGHNKPATRPQLSFKCSDHLISLPPW